MPVPGAGTNLNDICGDLSATLPASRARSEHASSASKLAWLGLALEGDASLFDLGPRSGAEVVELSLAMDGGADQMHASLGWNRRGRTAVHPRSILNVMVSP